MSIHQKSFELKPYSITELAKVYSVCNRTIKKWMRPFEKEIGEKQGRYYTVSQVKVVFEKIGLPGMTKDE
ncbi:MAG: hypothetical protein RIQ33_533 [Bacteroidota bacterium]